MDVAGWLRGLELGEYEDAFRRNDVTADLLPSLTVDDLRDLGVRSVGHRRRLLDAIATLRSGRAAPEAHAASDAERRHLTVMFVDLADSTALSARLDPEDMREVIRAYQQAVAREIAALSGYVAKFMGDGVLAYFGWPEAHEDDAERAVRAGLAAVRATSALSAVGGALACRVGLASGLVVVGDLTGDGAAKERAIVGDAPNLAARLQQIAAPGQVVVAESVRRLAGAAFDLVDLGPRALKGFDAPTRAYAVAGERSASSRFAARHAEGGGEVQIAPLLGREAELAALKRLWAEAASGSGRCVVLVGEPGIGKSRLAMALTEAEPRAAVRIVHQGSPYHADTSLHPAIQQLRRDAGVSAGEDDAAALDRVDRLLAKGGVAGGEAAALVAGLVGLDPAPRHGAISLPPALRRARTLDAIVGWVTGLARHGTVLWLVEDAHWIDPTTRELLGRAAGAIREAAVLVVVTSRPGGDLGLCDRPEVARLVLDRLDRAAAEALALAAAGGKPLPPQVVREIVDRTDGVPFYVEEMTKAVLESGALRERETEWTLDAPFAHLGAPTSLQASLLARLDRSPSTKKVAQTAAVIGRSFDLSTLSALSALPAVELAQAVEQLVASGLLQRRDGDGALTFRHALVRDAAYESLLKSRRRALHARLLVVLEAEGVVGSEVLARHAQAAGEVERSVDWWRAAGDAAVGRAAFAEAEAHLDAARELAPSIADPARRDLAKARVAVARAHATMVRLGYSHPRTEALYAEADALAAAAGDAGLIIAARYGLWVGRHVREEVGAALDVAHRMVEAASGAAEPEMAALAHRVLGVSLMMEGALDEAKASLERSHKIYGGGADDAYRASAHVDAVVAADTYLGLVLLALGEVDAARTAADAAIAASDQAGKVHDRVNALWHASVGAALSREPARAKALRDQVAAAAAMHHLAFWNMACRIAEGADLLESGDPERAVERLTGVLEASRATGLGTYGVLMRCVTAEAMAAAGDPRALDTAREAEAHARRTGALYALSEAQRLQGVVLRLARPDAPHEAEAAFRAALDTAERRNARFWGLRAALDLARLLAAQDRSGEAASVLEPAVASFGEDVDTPDLRDARAALRELAVAASPPQPSAGADSVGSPVHMDAPG